MEYDIAMTPTAEQDLRQAFEYIRARNPENAQRWVRGLYDALNALEKFPARCALAPEATQIGESVRHHIFKSHRIIFIIDEPAKIVRILYVRHGRMRAIGERYEGEE